MASIRKRSRKDGTTGYRVEIRLKGHPAERATFTRLTDAKRWAQDTESAIRDGRYFKTRESQRHTLADLIDTFIDDSLTGKKTGQKTAAQLKWWRGELGHYVLADVTPGRITECKKKLLAGITRRGASRSPATANRYLAALSVCLSYGVRDLGWLEDSPSRKVKKSVEPRGRVRFLSEGPGGELERLTQACKESTNPYLHTAFTLALSTGMRQAETMTLTWADVDLNQGAIILHETKNGERRRLPLVGKALELMKDHPRRIDTPLLFPGKVKKDKPMDLRAPWHAALRVAQIDDFHWHDIRHTTASYLAMNGASLAEIAEILGHKTLAMVKRYSHLSDAHTTGVMERMNRRIFGEGE